MTWLLIYLLLFQHVRQPHLNWSSEARLMFITKFIVSLSER